MMQRQAAKPSGVRCREQHSTWLIQDFPTPKDVGHQSELKSPDSSWRKPRTFQVDVATCHWEKVETPAMSHGLH